MLYSYFVFLCIHAAKHTNKRANFQINHDLFLVFHSKGKLLSKVFRTHNAVPFIIPTGTDCQFAAYGIRVLWPRKNSCILASSFTITFSSWQVRGECRVSEGSRAPSTGLNPFTHRHSGRFECRVMVKRKITFFVASRYLVCRLRLVTLGAERRRAGKELAINQKRVSIVFTCFTFISQAKE